MVSSRYLKAELLVASLYASRRSYDLVTLSRFYVVFLGPKTNVNLVPQIDVAWRACHATRPSGSTMSPYSCLSNTKLSPDAEILCFALPVILASACNTDTTPTQPHRNSNTHRTKNNTTNVVIQQKSRKLLMMDILMSETC